MPKRLFGDSEADMQRNRNETIRLVYGIVLSVLTVIVGLMFILEAADIYFSGVAAGGAANGQIPIYTRELVGERLMQLLAPAIIWIVAIVAGYVLAVLFPAAEKRRTAGDFAVLSRLRGRMPLGEGEEFSALREKFGRSERVRFAVWTACALVWLIAAVMCCVYLFGTAFDTSRMLVPERATEDILELLANVLPWFAAAFVVCVGALVFDRFYAKRQLPRMKQLLALGRGSAAEPRSPLSAAGARAAGVLSSPVALCTVRAAVLTVAVVFFIVGIQDGGMREVLHKAVTICTECIGLG